MFLEFGVCQENQEVGQKWKWNENMKLNSSMETCEVSTLKKYHCNASEPSEFHMNCASYEIFQVKGEEGAFFVLH